MRTNLRLFRQISILAALGVGCFPQTVYADPPLPKTTSSEIVVGALIGVEAIGAAGDLNDLVSITVTRTGESYNISVFPTGVRIMEDGWSESPRNSLTYKPYHKLLTGIGFIRNPWKSAGTLEIDPATGAVDIHFLTDSGHGHSLAEAEALAVSQDGRTIISLFGALLSLDIGQEFWQGANWLNDYFSGAGGISALAFSPDGVLYGWSHAHGMVRIDPGFSGYINYPVDFVKAVGAGTGGIQMSSIEFIEDGTLIGIQPGGLNQPTAFYVIDPFSGSTTHIGSIDRRIMSLARPGDWQLPNYVALGDSFSSGEGARPYYVATNRRGVNECRRSTHAWSTTIPGNRADYRLDTAFLHPLARPAFPACSGALIEDLFQPRDHEGEAWSNPPGSQLASLAPDVDVVTMTIGGNDMGFGDLVRLCLILDSCDQRFIAGGLTIEDWAMARIAEISGSGKGSLEDAYLAAANLGAVVYVLGYPDVLAASNESCALPESTRNSYLGRLLFWLMPEGYPFQNSELRMFRRLSAALNGAIACSAKRAGVHAVITEVFDKFRGHEVCAHNTPYINGLARILNLVIPPCRGCERNLNWKETLHPNLAGQAAFAESLQEYVLSVDNPWENPPSQSCHAASTPMLFGRDTASLPVLGELDLSIDAPSGTSCGSARAFTPGQTVQVRGMDYAPSSEVVLKLVARNGASENLGSVTTDAGGDLSVDVSIPTGATTGIGAVIEARGTSASGMPLVLLGYLVLVAAPEADSDGDGVQDICDNCLDLANEGQEDVDLDLVGDACDACPVDAENDIDGDRLCGDIDPAPYIPQVLFADGFEAGDTSAWYPEFPRR
jgi:hypothetical protein